jgi:hypothetical protein
MALPTLPHEATSQVMSDSLQASRLPDLPVAGYSTRKQRELTDAIMFLIRGFERERLLLLETVILGRELWRKRFIKAFRVIGADEEFADAVFGYFVLLAGPNPEAQKAILEGQQRQLAQQQWDKRRSTQDVFAKANRELHANIRKELRERRKKRVFNH